MEGLFNSIVQKAQGDLLLFMVLLAVVIIVAIKLLYKPMSDYLTLKEQKKNEREGRLLEVIQGNSSVMSELKTLLTNTNENCRSCKSEQIAYFKRFEEKQDTNALVLNDIDHNIDTIAQNLTDGKNNCIVVLTKLDGLLEAIQNKDQPISIHSNRIVDS